MKAGGRRRREGEGEGGKEGGRERGEGERNVISVCCVSFVVQKVLTSLLFSCPVFIVEAGLGGLR